MNTAHDFSYIILRLLMIPCPFSLSTLSWIFARLRENKDINSCHLKERRTGKAEENGSESSRSQPEKSHLSSSCHLGIAFQVAQAKDLSSVNLICFSSHCYSGLQRGQEAWFEMQLENHSFQSRPASDVF